MKFILQTFAGINNVDDLRKKTAPQAVGGTLILPGELKTCLNFRIRKSGLAEVRNGMTSKYSGSDIHDLFISRSGTVGVFVEGSKLKKLNADYTATELFSGLTVGATMRYQEHNKIIYMGNGNQMLKYDGVTARYWGTDRPLGAPVLAADSNGNCFAGTYYVGYTYVQRNGHESGMSELDAITVTAGQGIAISGLTASADSQVYLKRIYATTCNGKPNEAIFLIGEILNAATTFTHRGQDFDMHIENTTRFYRRPPASNIILSHYGQMYVAQGEYLFASEPLLPEAFRITQYATALHLDEEITALSNDSDHIYLHTLNMTYPLRGRAYSDMVMLDPQPIGALPGQPQRPYYTPIWLSRRGWAMGNAGQVAYLDHENFRLDLPTTARAYMGYDDVNKEIIGVIRQ